MSITDEELKEEIPSMKLGERKRLRAALDATVDAPKPAAAPAAAPVAAAPAAAKPPPHVRALVVGCGSYRQLQELDNPGSDAVALAELLRSAGAEARSLHLLVCSSSS